MVDVKDLVTMPAYKNKEEIPVLNHRDDGELRALRFKESNKETCKVFDFKTFFELRFEHRFQNADICIAEDFFWTGMPIYSNGELNTKEDWKDILEHAVVASSWGTPTILDNDNDKAYACYIEVPMDKFPGVYFKDWSPDFANEQVDKVGKYVNELAKFLGIEL